MKAFLLSLGRYGKGAFLYPRYGVSDILQAFCRMCAVYGGFYMLRTNPLGLVQHQGSDKNEVIVDGIVTPAGQFVAAHILQNA